MEPTFRSGDDRRIKVEFMGNDKRTGIDRRKLIDRIEQYSRILEKVPVFKGLSVEQLKRILSISSHKTLPENETLCKVGDESDEIYVIIKGQLLVTFPDGREIARINPLGIVGEMGVFTGNPRSATVVTAEECLLITIKKHELMVLFKQEPDLSRIILLNVISDLSNKLLHINKIFEKLLQLHIIE